MKAKKNHYISVSAKDINKKCYSESVGIGLSLAKNIIEKNNGKIDVYSKDGKTIFTIKYYK